MSASAANFISGHADERDARRTAANIGGGRSDNRGRGDGVGSSSMRRRIVAERSKQVFAEHRADRADRGRSNPAQGETSRTGTPSGGPSSPADTRRSHRCRATQLRVPQREGAAEGNQSTEHPYRKHEHRVWNPRRDCRRRCGKCRNQSSPRCRCRPRPKIRGAAQASTVAACGDVCMRV